MKARLFPKLVAPCKVQWSELPGAGKKRYCDQCGLHVHNFSVMTPSEKLDYLSDRSERKCVAYPIEDDTACVDSGILTWYYKVSAVTRRALIPLLAAFSLGGCAATPETPPPSTCPPVEEGKQVKEEPDGKIVMGGILYTERPLWQRILWPF